MPYLERHGNGKRVCWRTGGRGSPIEKSETFESKAEWMAELRARTDQCRARKKTGRAIIAWSEVRTRWLLFLAEQSRTESYIDQARDTLERTTAEWKTTADATPSAMAALKIGPWRLAKACLRWARTYLGQEVDHGAIGRRPHRPTAKPQPDLLSDAKVASLIKKAAIEGGISGRVLAHLVATYGHRPQSLVMITVGDVQLGKQPRLTMPVKSGDTIRHPILPETADLLRKAIGKRKKTAPLLLDPLGNPWTSGGKAAAWFWHRVGDGLGIYQLKCYAISRMMELKLDLKTIASITGHRTPAVLLRYARTNETRQLAALSAIAGNPQPDAGATPVLPTKVISY